MTIETPAAPSPEELFDHEMCVSFPKLYADRHASMKTTCMCWGFDVGPGWYDIVRRLSTRLEAMIVDLESKLPEGGWPCAYCLEPASKHPTLSRLSKFDGDPVPGCDRFTPSHPKASQVKSKYATLRFYMTCSTEEMEVAIDEAEAETAKTCEVCGQPGQIRDGGWLETLCDSCDAKR